MIQSFSFEIITEPDGTIRLANPKFDELPWGVVHFLMGGLLSGAKEYNEKKRDSSRCSEPLGR